MDFQSTQFVTNVTNLQSLHKPQLGASQSMLRSDKPQALPFLCPQDFPVALNLPSAWSESGFMGGDFSHADKFLG